MRAKSIALLIVGVVSLAGFIVALNERAARQAAEAAALQTEAQRFRLAAESRQVELRVAAAEKEHEELQVRLNAERRKNVASKPEPARATPVVAAQGPANALREALLHDPRMQNLQLAAVQAKLLATYRPFCEQSRLTEAQVAQLLVNLRKRGEQDMDLSAIMETQQLRSDDAVITNMRRQMAEEFRTAQVALLGDEGYQRFETYERSTPPREFVNEFAGAAAILGAGITAAQADALTDAMANASAAYGQGKMATRNLGDLDWNRVLTQAAVTLSESQLVVFKNAVIQARNMDQIRQLARRK